MEFMIVGFLVALLLFAPLSYLVTRGIITQSHRSERPFLGILFLFLGLLAALSLLSFALLAAASIFGMTAAVGIDVASTSNDMTRAGAVTAVGGLLMMLYSTIGIFTGPACAFIVAKIMAIVGLVAALVKIEQTPSVTWLPVVAAGVTVFCMWPFTAYLTLGL